VACGKEFPDPAETIIKLVFRGILREPKSTLGRVIHELLLFEPFAQSLIAACSFFEPATRVMKLVVSM